MSKYTRSGSAESQNQGAMESMPGNLLHDNPDLPAGLNTVIGSARWIEGSSIIYMVYNSNGDHTIWSYNINDFSITLVLGNWLLGNGGTALNFQLSNKVYHTNIVDNLLYWTDGYFDNFEYNDDGLLQFNPPRKIDINKAIKYMASFGADPEGYPTQAFDTLDNSFHTMDALKCPPVFKPNASYQTNTDKSFNKLYGNQYQFAYQYVYNNNEESKWSMFSNQPFPTQIEYVSGRNTDQPLLNNEISVLYYTGAYDVTKIRFAVRVGENGVWSTFQEIDKKQTAMPDNSIESIVFDGNRATKVATFTEFNFDSVPQVAKAQEVLSNNSLVYGNYFTDYDLLNDLDIEIERDLFNVDFESRAYKNVVVIGNIADGDPWEIDPFGRTSTGCQINLNSPSDFFFTFEFVEGDKIIFPLYNLTGGPDTLQNYYYSVTAADIAFPGNPIDKLINLANNISAMLISEGIPNTVVSTPGGGGTNHVYIDTPGYWTGQGDNLIYDHTCTILRENKCVKSLKKGSKKVFGIQYYDRGNRSGSVQYKASGIIPLELDIPYPSQEDLSFLTYPGNPYYVKAKLNINHIPPEWATHYQILVKKDELMTNFQQRAITDIIIDPNGMTYKISLENLYTNTYKGTTINQTPQKGDIVRFLYKAPSIFPSPTGFYYTNPDYCDVYFETEVLEYLPTGGSNLFGFGPSQAIVVSQFDFGQIFNGITGFIGSVCEIYTPKKESDDEIWYEIQDPSENYDEGYVILNPHTENRVHAGNLQNQTDLIPAIVSLDYGDVYLRAREYATGYAVESYGSINDFPGFPGSSSTGVSGNLHTLYAEVITGSVSKLYYFLGDQGGVSGSGYYLLYTQDLFNVNAARGYYWIEDYNYSDYYTSDDHGLGRFGIDDINAKRRHLKSSVIHSLPYVQNSTINGLSSFQGVGSSRYLDDTFGSINRLKQVGYTLKVLQDRKETAIYIQKSYATGGDGAGQLAYTDKVFGGINPYDTLFGTVHPGSVQLIEGDLYYFDYHTGAFIRTSNNGQNDISSGKYKFNYYTSTKATDISLNFDRYDIISMIDEQNMEYTCFFNDIRTQEIINCRIPVSGYVISAVNSTENLINTLPPGTLILLSGSSPENDVYNTVVSVELVGTDDYDITVANEVTLPSNVGFTIFFNEYSTEGVVFSYLRDRWITLVDYTPMWAETLGVVNVSWDINSQTYSHNDGPELNFYGLTKTQLIDFVMNESAITIKRLLTMGIRSNSVFNVDSVTTPVSGSYPAMNSEIPSALFKLKEGYYWSAYLRDKTNVNLSDPYLRTIELALQNGRQLRGYVFEHVISQNSTSKVVLFSIKTTYVPSEALI
jgi:hypothetical protein